MSSEASSSGTPPLGDHSGGVYQPTPAQIEEANTNIRDKLRKLRNDDVASLCEQHKHKPLPGPLGERIHWAAEMIKNVGYYCLWLIRTWTHVISHNSFVKRNISFSDWISIFLFAYGASIILALIWAWVCISTFPPIVKIYNWKTGKCVKGISLVNSMNPELFKNLTEDQLKAGKEGLANHPDPNAHNPRVFNLDIAKVLLQIASLMYERSDEDRVDEMKTISRGVRSHDPYSTLPQSNATTNSPGLLFSDLVGKGNADMVNDRANVHSNKARDPVDKWAKTYQINYEPVSELATLSQAYCSIFWDPKSTWMVVAFKGTDPRSFEEWTTDFTAAFTKLEKEIPNFKFGHRGFKEAWSTHHLGVPPTHLFFIQRLFPSEINPGQRAPWETVLAAIKVVSEQLTNDRGPGAVCNVWFTGHSLGTALATLAYAKALTGPDHIGPKAMLRDAYLFATPITVDAASRKAFNAAMYVKRNIPRTMWRVTNRDDFVATGLPALGDSDTLKIDPDNQFGFSHLGIEIFMKSGPVPCEVKGNRITDPKGDYEVHIWSKFSEDEVIDQRKEAVLKQRTVRKIFRWLQYIPIVGRLAAHASTNYYDQLDQIAIRACIDRPGP